MIEPWRHVWRVGFAPQLSTAGLRALADALRRDDVRLLQGATTLPPPMRVIVDWPCEGACAVAYAGWQGDGLSEVGAVSDFFAAACGEADKRLNEAAGCRWFLTWHDEAPRAAVLRELLPEVERALALRPAD